MKPTILAISGWKRSGKDATAEYLIKNFGAERIAFADPLKELVGNLFGLYRSQIDSPESKEAPLLNMPVQTKDAFTGMIHDFMSGELRDELGRSYGNSDKYWSPRALCILLGSTLRAADPDFWVKKAVAKTQPGGLYVISDCRYKNEIEALKKTGATVVSVRINRFENSPSNDPSERDLDNYTFDHVISNTGTLEELHQKAKELMEGI